MELGDLHHRLHQHVENLRLARGEGAKVYLIEHGLTQTELEEVRTGVGRRLTSTPLSRSTSHGDEWRSTFLPLAVVATEVGYKYGTGGNEYWPCLSDALGVPFSDDDRHALADRFAGLREVTQVALADTTWTQRFNLIAWPITHAVLPVWLHEPLLEAINACPHRIGVGSDPEDTKFLSWMRAYAARAPKLAAFLDQKDSARAIVCGLLGRASKSHFSEELLARFLRDIKERPRSKQLLRDAISTHAPRPTRAAPKPARGQLSAGIRQPQVIALSLILDASAPALEVLPVGDGFDASLDRVRVRPLGLGRLVSLGTLLRSGSRLDVSMLRSADATPLLIEEDLRALEKSLVARLEALTLDTRDPILFTEARAGGGRAHQVLDRYFSETRGVWVLTQTTCDDLPGAVVEHSMVAGWRCYEVDATDPDGAQWLEGQGFTRSRSPRVEVVGAPSFEAWRGVAGPLLASDLLAFVVSNGPVEVSQVGPLADGCHILDLASAEGYAPLRLSQPGVRDASVSLTIVPTSPSRAPLIQICLDGPAFTVRALKQHTLTLRISGAAPLAGLRATLRLKQAGKTLGRSFTQPLVSLPALLKASDPAWTKLLTEGHLDEGQQALLEVDVAGLGGAGWLLDAADVVAPLSGATGVVLYAADLPYAPLAANVAASSSTLLHQPVTENELLLGQGVCRRSTSPTFVVDPRHPARILRREEDASSATGVAAIRRAYLAWATANSEDLIAEAHRHAAAARLDEWLAGVLCGERWAVVERRRAVHGEDFGSFAARRLYEEGVARDSCLEEDFAEACGVVVEAMLRELGGRLNAGELWLAQVASRACGVTDACSALASMVNDSYKGALVLAQPQLLSQGLSADVACEEDSTVAALGRVMTEWDSWLQWRDALELVLPQATRARLEGIDFACADDEWFLEDVCRVLSDARSKWSEREAGALLTFWVRPRQFSQTMDLHRALNDRWTTRLLRYAAVRRRESLGVRL